MMTLTTLATFLPKRLSIKWLAFMLAVVFGILLLKSTSAQSENPLPPFSDKVISKIKTITMIGQVRGNYPEVFTKVGDSITVNDRFLYAIGNGTYQLGDAAYLQPVIDAFLQTPVRNGNSFNNPSVATYVGWAANSALSPRTADPYQCQAGESPLVCEYRITQPSIAFIMFGTNDLGYRTQDEYRHDMQTILDTSMEMGVI